MKKLMALAATAALCTSLCACSGTTTSTTASIADSTQASTESQASSEDQTTTVVSLFDYSTTIDETVLVDNEYALIKATSLTYKNNNAYINIEIQNKYSKKIDITTNTLGYSGNYVNNYMVSDGWMSCDVKSGETATDEIRISTDTLQLYGINCISEIGLGFRIVDSDYNELYEDTVSLMTSSYSDSYSNDGFINAMNQGVAQASYGYELEKIMNTALLDAGGFQISNEILIKNQSNERVLFLDCQNGSTQDIIICISDITLNGTQFNTSTWTSEFVISNKNAVINLSLDDIIEYGYKYNLDDDAEEAYENGEGLDSNSVVDVVFNVELYDANGNTLTNPVSISLSI